MGSKRFNQEFNLPFLHLLLISSLAKISQGIGYFPDPEPRIYLATSRGLKSYNLINSQVKDVRSKGSTVWGFTYDPVEDKIYWGLNSDIFRSNPDGARLCSVPTTSCTSQQGLDSWAIKSISRITAKH